MDFKTYYLSISADQRKKLAERADTSVEYLCQLAYGHRVASRKLAERIQAATGKKVSAVEMLFSKAA